MIKKFKLFERKYYSNEDELVDQLSEDTIEKYFKNHHEYSDIRDIIDMLSTRNILDAFDDEKYKRDYIDEYVNSYDFSDLDKDDLKYFIEQHMTEQKEEKILDIYNSNNYYEDDIKSDIEGIISFKKSKKDRIRKIIVTSSTGEIKTYNVPKNNKVVVEEGESVIKDELLSTEKETSYEDYMLDELDKDELRDVIEDSNQEGECIEEVIEGWYSGESGEDIIENMYGRMENMDAKQLYDYISYYVDEQKLLDDWNEGESFDYKKETVARDIEDEPDLQREILERNPKMVLTLAELIEGKPVSKTIGDEYDFQKAYIEQYTLENADEEDAEDIKDKKEDAVLYLDDEYGLDDDIRKEYQDYMLKVTMKKYNL